MTITRRHRLLLAALLCLAVPATAAGPAEDPGRDARDARVRAFLEAHAGRWKDMNVPESDGRLLHDLILERGFTRALEIGTSTGRSAIWIAWALSRTGGRLVTIEIDAGRHAAAVANFEAAGLADRIDARLADAHVLVEELAGPFDFVFSDADKDWSTRYFTALAPKIVPGGCFAAHNASMRSAGVREFLDHVRGLAVWETRIDTTSPAGMAISCRRPSNGRTPDEGGPPPATPSGAPPSGP